MLVSLGQRSSPGEKSKKKPGGEISTRLSLLCFTNPDR
jgi:hypothetical protein